MDFNYYINLCTKVHICKLNEKTRKAKIVFTEYKNLFITEDYDEFHFSAPEVWRILSTEELIKYKLLYGF